MSALTATGATALSGLDVLPVSINVWRCMLQWIGGMGVIASPGSLRCTGSLLADFFHDSEIPYFLTANHCVSTASVANTLEIYWLYESSVCNNTDSVPNILGVPRTIGGADLLATTNGRMER